MAKEVLGSVPLTLSNGSLQFSTHTAGFDVNPDGPIVICLHGFPDNARSFRYQLPALAEAGYRAVAPTMRGYEPSSVAGDDDYSLATLGRDVVAWVEELGADQVHLVGHDWGAAVTYVAGALAPERFASLSTIAVPHAARFADGIRKVPRQAARSWYMSFFQLRGVAEYTIERNDWALLRRLYRTWSPGFDVSEDDWTDLVSTFAAPGVKAAMLAYYRQNASPGVLLGWKESEAAGLTTVPVRTLAITGEDDGCIDTRLYDHVFVDDDFPNGVKIERVSGAGHFVHQEQPDKVNSLLLNWLAEQP